MKINNQFSITRDRYNYILTHTGEYTNLETGEITHPETRSYYPNLESCCRGIIKRDIDCDSVETILTSLERLQKEIGAAIMMSGGSL